MIDAKTFHTLIEDFVEANDCEYVDAVLSYQKKTGIEIETISSLIKQSPALKAKIQEEAEAAGSVKPEVKKLQF